MDAPRSVTAWVKEKIQSRSAKHEMKKEFKKSTSIEKLELKTATDKTGKHEAKAKKHLTEAELREYDKNVVQNAAEREQTKVAALSQEQAAKHSDEPLVVGHNSAVRDTRSAPDHSWPSSSASERAKLIETHPSSTTTLPSDSSPAAAPDRTPAPPRFAVGKDSFPNSTPLAQGTGVPTHSTLHSDGNDQRTTTNTMGGSPNTGSYM